MSSSIRLAAALALGAGVALGGWLAGRGLVEARAGERFVSVKGLSERDVAADLALWPIRYVITGDDLTSAQARIEADGRRVRAFLDSHGIPASAIQQESLEVTDLQAQPYRSGPIETRFILSATLLVRSEDVATIDAASQSVSALVADGVVLGGGDGGPGQGPIYLFTDLAALKPGMIAEATANARDAATQFAADSASRLGAIRRANQGVFQILAGDDAPGLVEHRQIRKTVRVVSTLEYYLVD